MPRTQEDPENDRPPPGEEAMHGFTFSVVAPLIGIVICLGALAIHQCGGPTLRDEATIEDTRGDDRGPSSSQ